VKKVTTDGNTVSVARSGSDLIDGQTIWIISSYGDALASRADGVSNWYIE